jgi:hypothetical protein
MPRYGSVARGLAAGLTLLAAVAGCRSTSTSVTGPSATAKCRAAVTVSTREFNAQGGTGKITVSTERDCQWKAESNVPWLTFASPDAGQGSGTADFVVAATPDPVTRTASVSIADQDVSITQRAAACQFRLSIAELSVPASGGGRDIDVTASSALCEWSAQADVNWVGFPSGRAFKGNGRVVVESPTWAGPLRRAELVVAGQRVLLTQANGCAYNISPPSAVVPAAAGRTTVAVQTVEGCGWSTANQVPWVTVAGGAAMTGPGVALLDVSANPGRARSGTLTVAGRPFAISQPSGCVYTVSTHTATWGPEGGFGAIGIDTAPDCPWATSTQLNWIVFISNSSGAGPGTITFLVTPNLGGPRSGTMTIEGHTFTAHQLGVFGTN